MKCFPGNVPFVLTALFASCSLDAGMFSSTPKVYQTGVDSYTVTYSQGGNPALESATNFCADQGGKIKILRDKSELISPYSYYCTIDFKCVIPEKKKKRKKDSGEEKK